MGRLGTGDDAPDFSLENQDGREVSLASFSPGRVLVYFYPKDDTPGCTTEARQFEEHSAGFKEAGIAVIGISPDSAESHLGFKERHGLRFDLLCDPDHQVAEAYGAWGEKNRYGKKYFGIIRSTFLVGPDGKIERAWYNVRAEGHAARVLAEAS